MSKALVQQRICLLDIDTKGAARILREQGQEKEGQIKLECNYLFVRPPSLEILRERLEGRGTETKESIEKRMRNAEIETKQAEQMTCFEYIVNDNKEKFMKEAHEYLRLKYF